MPSVGKVVTTSYLYDVNDERISSSKEQRRVGDSALQALREGAASSGE